MTAVYASAASAAVSAAVAAVTVTKPSGAAVGDRLLAICWANNLTATWVAPLSPAWTSVGSDSSIGMAAFTRVVDGTEGADFTFTRTGTSGTAGVICVRLTGAGTVQAVAFTAVVSNNNLALTGVTAAADNLLVQGVTTLNGTADSWTPPGTATERIDTTASGTAVRFAVGDEVVGAGATGSRTWVHTTGQSARGALIAVNPIPAQTLNPGGISSGAAAGSPTVAPGAVTVQPDGSPSTAAAGEPTVTPGAVTVSPSGRASTAQLGEPTVAADTVTTARPEGISSSTVTGTPTVTPGSVTASPVGVASGASAGAPTLQTGPVAVEPAGIAASTEVGAPTVEQGPVIIRPAGIASTATLGEPTVAEPIRPDECWPVDLSCVPHWDDVTDDEPPVPVYSEAQKQRAIALGIESLRTLTGYRVGGCPTILRPCKAGCTGDTWRTYPVGYPGGVGWMPVLVSGTWLNVACGCAGDGCSCSSISQIVLPQPLGRISEVKIDGIVLPSTAYRLDPGGRLVRTDGGRWPICQNIAEPDTEEGTWSITVRPGVEPDTTAQFMAGIMAGEFLRACTGDDACRLPVGVTQIARLGVTMSLGTGAFPEGRTGIREVDVWLDRWNPNRLRSRATVMSPDVHRPRPQGR